jgi:membrane-bound metal-dependent hydrolase YbcI (DUF457 family)
MQTYTHMAMGAVLGTAFSPGNHIAEAVCVIASAVPDLTMVPQYALDMLAKRQPMTKQSSGLMIAKEIGHSLPLWFLIFILTIFFVSPMQSIALAGVLGGLAHIIVDVLTHGTGSKSSRPYWDTDTKFMWPTQYDLRPLGLWEYRIDYGVLRPKPFELFVLFACLGVTIANIIMR